MYKLKKSKYLILLPSFNELNNLKKFVIKLKKISPICVLDDGSTDGTSEWLKKNKINFYRNKINLGYEKNLINGIKKFKKNCDYLITFDADGQHKISDLKKILQIKVPYDIMICNRKVKNRVVENTISFIFNFFYKLKDPLSGFKVYRSKILKKKNFDRVNEYFLVDFLITFINKYKIINYEITTKDRKDNSRVGNNIEMSLKELKILFKIIF